MNIKTVCGILALILCVTSRAAADKVSRSEKPAAGPEAKDKPTIALVLRDGSRLLGEPSIQVLPLRTSYAKIKVPLGLVKQVQFADNQETATVSCTSGDELHGVVDLDEITVATRFAKIRVPLKEIARINVAAEGTEKGLILHYSFDKDESGKVTDLSGNGNDGTVVAASYGKGKFGRAIHLNGKDQYVSLPSVVTPASNLTIAVWINVEDMASHHAAFRGHAIYFWGPRNGCNPSAQILFTDPEERIQFCIGCGTGLSSQTKIHTGVWYHVVLTLDQDGKACLYLNGRLEGGPVDAWGGQIVSTGDDLLGAGWGGGVFGKGWEPFAGSLDEVKVFDHALDENEVSAVYGLGH